MMGTEDVRNMQSVMTKYILDTWCI